MINRHSLVHSGIRGQLSHTGRAGKAQAGSGYRKGGLRNDGKVIGLPWHMMGRAAARLRASGETGGWLSATSSEWLRSGRDALIRERLLSIDPAKTAWAADAVFCGDMVYVCSPMVELPDRILQAAFDLNADVFDHSVYELHLYEAALRILATGKWQGYGEGSVMVERARQELARLEADRPSFYTSTARLGDETIRSYGPEDEMVVVLQDVGDALQVVATTRIFRNHDPQPLGSPATPGQGTPFDKSFRIDHLPDGLAAQLEARGVVRRDLVEVGKLARRRDMSKADGMRAMAALYVGVCERVVRGGGSVPYGVMGYTHEKFLAQMDRVGFPSTRIPDISLNEDVFGSAAATYVVSRLVCAGLDNNLSQLDTLFGPVEARRVAEQIALARADMGHTGPMASLGLEIFVVPVAEGLPTIDRLRNLVRNPARALWQH